MATHPKFKIVSIFILLSFGSLKVLAEEIQATNSTDRIEIPMHTQLFALCTAIKSAFDPGNAQANLARFVVANRIEVAPDDPISKYVLRLKLKQPVNAYQLSQVMGWARPYISSPVVHQTSWNVRLWKEDVSDPYGPRVHLATPAAGVWIVNAQVDHRPSGRLPGVSAGASPAYDLPRYTGESATSNSTIQV